MSPTSSNCRPPPSRKGKERARALPTPPSAAAEDPKYLRPFYNTRLGKAFGNPEKYAKLHPNSYEAGEFRKGRYDLDSFTPGHLHPTFTPPPPMRKLPPAQARAARAKAKLGSLLPPNKLRVRRPLLFKRGRPPFQVPNHASLLLASPLPLTRTLSPLLLPFLTSPLASSANRTASSPLASPLLLTLVAPSL